MFRRLTDPEKWRSALRDFCLQGFPKEDLEALTKAAHEVDRRQRGLTTPPDGGRISPNVK